MNMMAKPSTPEEKEVAEIVRLIRNFHSNLAYDKQSQAEGLLEIEDEAMSLGNLLREELGS